MIYFLQYSHDVQEQIEKCGFIQLPKTTTSQW